MPPFTAATETKMTHFSTPRHLELLPCLSIEIVPYYNHELDEERTGLVVCFSWLTETKVQPCTAATGTLFAAKLGCDKNKL